MYLLLLLSLCWLSSWGLQNVYITPDGNCSTANGTVLEPCYTLNQLGNLSSHLLGSSVALLFLPGTHMLQEQLGIDKFKQVVMSPLKEDDKVVINCSYYSQNNVFLGSNRSMTISSLQFTTCSLRFGENVTVNIMKSMFEKSDYSALYFGCMAIKCWTTSHVNIANCMFLSNAGGIVASRDHFPRQSAQQHMNITNTIFQDNGRDGSRVFYVSQYEVSISNTCFIRNRKSAIMATFSALDLVNTTFNNNYAEFGGSAIAIIDRGVALNISNCSFIDNSAEGNGAVVHLAGWGGLHSINNSIFQGNVARGSGGAIYAKSGMLSLYDCQFVNNSAKQGGALWLSIPDCVTVTYIILTTFVSNKAEQGGAVYSASDISFSTSFFKSNSAELNGGAVYLSNQKASYDVVTFSNNTALNGGALYAAEHVHSITANSITAVNNAAFDKGGAIFVSDVSNCDNEYCRIQFVETNTFSNNSAREGQVLYGGLLDRCFITDYQLHYDASNSTFTSDPVRVCLCNKNSEVDCATRHLTVDKQRGQIINLTGVVVDQDSKTKKGFVRANYVDFRAEFDRGEVRQQIDDNCTDMAYHVLTSHNNSIVQLILSPEGACEESAFSSVTVSINIIPCTRGFVKKTDRCVCDPRLSEYVTSCNVDALTIHAKKSRVWIHYDEQFLKVHNNCPLDYCEVSLTINLSSQDKQCANHRSGVICGTCQENYNIALGGSKCLDCSSSIAYAWLILVFAVAGIALVALLLVCNMTVSHGTLNGLIFYANVVSISGLTSFQDCSVHPLLSVFIAWINLDFGVESCFYPGMDTYQKTWLQFAFPLYIWILVGAIILISQFSKRAVKVFGKNNIAVLATLFLLSYSKFLKTIITALSLTPVYRGSASNTSDPLVSYNVWVHDCNIDYLKGKHVPLFAVAFAFLVFLFLPYTLLLTFGQCIRSFQSRNKCVLWFINSTAFVSIMDAYHAPYTNRHRYWTGFMLFVRCVIFLGFASSFDNSFSNMYIALVCLVTVISLRSAISKVYRNFGVNILEIIFLLNLAVLLVSVLYLRSNESSDDVLCMCSTASLFISLAMFIAILVYHAYNRLSRNKYFKSFEGWLLAKRQFFRHQYKRANPTDDQELPETHLPEGPTTSYVELREKLLET